MAIILVIFTSALLATNVSAEETAEGYDPGIDDLSEVLASMPDVDANFFDPEKKKALIEKYGKRPFTVAVDSIEPEGGPTIGNTRVLVRGGPLTDLEILFPHPKCKFGKYDNVVDATYVLCTVSPTAIEDNEPRHKSKVRI